jgi:hypothetical protein
MPKQFGLGVTGHDSRRVTPFGNPRIKGCRTYPRLIAADHVLHRLPAPRHSPCALYILATSPRLYQLITPGLTSKRRGLTRNSRNEMIIANSCKIILLNLLLLAHRPLPAYRLGIAAYRRDAVSRPPNTVFKVLGEAAKKRAFRSAHLRADGYYNIPRPSVKGL